MKKHLLLIVGLLFFAFSAKATSSSATATNASPAAFSSGLTSPDAADDAADALADAAEAAALEALADVLAADADALVDAEALVLADPEAALELDDPPHAASPRQQANNKPATTIARYFFITASSPFKPNPTSDK